MKVGIPCETAPRERRVALIPEAAGKLVSDSTEVLVETDAGKNSFFPNERYEQAGARLVKSSGEILGEADLILKVQPLTVEEVALCRPGSVVVSFLTPQFSLNVVKKLAERRVTAFSMDAVPRITRAQCMDALSSMSTIAGYKAVLRAASALGKIVPMLVTAAGTLPPARALILGAGVAGLQAIATARRLGAIVEAFDVRPAAKEQVESLGARFVEAPELDKDSEDTGGYAKELSEDDQKRNLSAIHQAIRNADMVISTALIPGKPAPTLITAEMVKDMKPGSVIVDIAAERGGNCVLTEPGKETVQHGVVIVGPVNLPSTAPMHASQMYSRNLLTFVSHVMTDGELKLDMNDEIVSAMCVTHGGEVVHEATKGLLAASQTEGGPE